MREYNILQTEFWINPLYSSLSLKAHLIGAYLMSCPHTDSSKGFKTMEEYVGDALCIDKRTIRRAIQELIEADFLSPEFKLGWKLTHFFKGEPKTVGKSKYQNGFSKNIAHYCRDI